MWICPQEFTAKTLSVMQLICNPKASGKEEEGGKRKMEMRGSIS
jgi:hypothetical protein